MGLEKLFRFIGDNPGMVASIFLVAALALLLFFAKLLDDRDRK